MGKEFPSLITSNPQTGLTLARQLADRLHRQIEQANVHVACPGGMNYLLSAPVPKEILASILFYAIAAANKGWRAKPDAKSRH
ncbi:MAG: hypothetical protein JWQ04_2640 [Pedosphaera sp.]|nr:hypothetical protein [Pedosphaera sp.]